MLLDCPGMGLHGAEREAHGEDLATRTAAGHTASLQLFEQRACLSLLSFCVCDTENRTK